MNQKEAAEIKRIEKICLRCLAQFSTNDLFDEDWCSDSCFQQDIDSDDDEMEEY